MSPLLRVLMLVDTVTESDMLVRELRCTGFELAVRRATSEAAYLAELDSPLDLILADTALPGLDAVRALQILRASALDIPLIIVTDLASEAAAITCVSLGAADFVFKDRPTHLGNMVIRVLNQRELRVYAQVTDAALRTSAAINQAMLDSLTAHIAVLNAAGVIIAVNQAWERFARANGAPDLLHTGVGVNYLETCRMSIGDNSAEAQLAIDGIKAVLARTLDQFMIEYPCHSPEEERWFMMRATPLAGEHTGVVVVHENITERRKADATRALLAAIVDSSDDAIISVAPNGTVMSWNTGAEHVYGYRADQMLGQPMAILRPPHLQDEVESLYDRVARGEHTTHLETVRLRNDGQLIDVAVTISAISAAGGGMSGFSTISRDISARKRGDHVLRQKTAFIQLFQEVAVAANQATSLEQALQTTIDTICTHIGWPVGHVYLPDPDMSGALLPTSIWHLEDTERFATFRKITEVVRLAPGVGLPGQVVVSRKPAWISDMFLDVSTPRTKLIRDLRVRAGFALPVLLGDQVAAVLEFFATEVIAPDEALLDILHHVGTQLGRVVERTRGEAALRESEARFRLLFEHSPDAIILIDPSLPEISWPIIDCNDVACRMNGYTREQLIGQSVDILNSVVGTPAERVRYTNQLRRAGTLQFETLHRRSDGSLFPVEVVTSLISIAGRELVVGIDRDISERKRAENALRAAEARYRTLIEQIPAIIYTAAIDEQSSSIYVSPHIKTTLGFTPEEWLATPDLWLELMHPDDRERVLETIGRTRVVEGAIPIEYRLFTRDGRMVWLRDATRVVRDEAGRPLFMQGISFDITERKLAELALLEREAYFRALIEHSADAIALLAVDGTILYGSPATLRVLGYSAPAFVGRNAFDLLCPHDRALYGEQLRDIGRLPKAPMWFAACVQHADGTWRDLEGMFTNLLHDSSVGAVVMNYRDITDRKRTQDALHASERLYRTLASNFPNGAVVLFDHDLRFTIADGASFDAFGMTREAMEGRTIWEVYSPELSTELEVSYRAALAGTPHVHETTQGEHSYVIHTLPVRDKHGEIIAGMLMSQDITDRKRMEEALIEERTLLARRVDERTADLSTANAELARTAVLKDEFLASMSHELRTPLNAVLGLSEAVQEEVYGPINDRQRRALYNIEESGRHLLELINDILDLARIGAGKLELELESSPIETICQASLRLIKQMAQKQQLSVDLTIDPAVTLLNVDARRVKQILVNLLSNAVKFTPAGGSIGLEVTGDAARQAVDLTVWDTGIGIAREQMTRLFQPFVQLDSRLARQYEGTGLGLALVYRMVELHGGSISATSEVERGSRFTVALPWNAASVAAQGSAPVASEVIVSNRTSIRRVLICEDSPTTADQITRYLHELEIESVIVHAGKEVVDLVIVEQPDLIILDLILPDISGWDVLALLKAEPRTRDTPVLIISVIDERSRGLALGAAEYLVKPIVYADLQRVLPILAPAPPGSASTQAPSANGTPAYALPLPVVLLAEDNEANITMISDYLATRGYQVVVARNGAEAIARAREARPAIVLMDIQMPGMDGLEATRRIRSIDELVDLPIIALTALAMPGDRERCLAAGANDYLSKPVSLRGLAVLIKNHLRQHSSEQRNHL